MTAGRRRVGAVVAGVVLCGALFVACGGGDDGDDAKAYVEPKGEATEQIEISAKNFEFTPDTIKAEPGIAEITLTSTAGLHDLVFDDAYPGFQLEVGTGDSDSAKIDLTKGTYTFYCTLAGHRAGGMEGTLTVK